MLARVLVSLSLRALGSPIFGWPVRAVILLTSRGGLSSLNLRGANLRTARLNKANLRGADLTGANLEQAWFIKADLSAAKLVGAKCSASLLETPISAAPT